MKILAKLLQKLFILSISGYQCFISPLFPPSCRFIPSCSEYSKECIRIHGPFKGMLLTILRLLKCHPLGGKGYNPVPKKDK